MLLNVHPFASPSLHLLDLDGFGTCMPVITCNCCTCSDFVMCMLYIHITRYIIRRLTSTNQRIHIMITETSSQEKGMFRKQVFMLQNVEQVVDTADEGVMLCLQDDICMITFYTMVLYLLFTLSQCAVRVYRQCCMCSIYDYR